MAKTKRFDFSWEFGPFAIRTRHVDWKDKNSAVNSNCPIEIVKYFDEGHTSCYTIAMWEKDDEGYELHFVGGRPFRDIEPEEIAEIWQQLRAAQEMLDAYFKAGSEWY